MDLKLRKAILNTLPKFANGLIPDDIGSVTGFEKMGPALFDSVANSKLENSMLKSGQFTQNSTGGLEAIVKSPKAGAGQFLKNNAGGIMNIASSAIDFVGTMSDISTNKISSDEMMGSGGTTNESANGISYQESKVDSAGYLNKIDATAKAGTMAAMGKGAALGGAIGSVIPGLGTVAGGAIGGVVGGIAGLFGSRKAKREAERLKRIALARTSASNTLNRETAYTIGLRNEFNRENRTDTSQSLFHAEEGIEGAVNPRTGATYKKHVVNTAYGKVKAPQNAWVSKGEVIRSKDGSLYRVQSGDNDTARAYLQNGDSVYSKKIINPETGNSIADDAASYAMAGQLDRLDMNLNVGRMMKEAGRRKTNLLPGFLGGTNKYKQLPGYFTGTPPYGKVEYLDDEPTGIVDQWQKDGSKLAQQMFGGATAPGYKDDFIVPYSTEMNDLGTGTRQYKDPLYKSPYAGNTAAMNGISSPLSGTTNTTGAGSSAGGNAGSKKPGLFGKIKGVLGGLGGNIDLDNITTLGSAFINAAQRDARAAGGLRAPKSFVANPYEQDALQQLNSLHSDYYPVWAQNREVEGRGKSAIALSGGLSAGQRMLGYMGLTNQTQQNNASALFEHQGRENALRAQAANASLEAGNLSATRQQQAYQWDEDMLAKAHAARENMLETSAYDRQNALESFFTNKFKKNQFDRTMNLYESQLKNDEAATRALIDNLSNTNTNNTVATQTTPTLADKASSVTTTAGTASIHPGQTTLPSAIPMIKAQIPQSVVKPVNSKRGRKTTMGTKKSSTKSRTSAVASTEGSQFVNKPTDTQFKPFAFGNNPAIEERFPNASKEAKLSRPNKEKAGRPAPTSNAEALSRVWEKLKLGKKEYERRYGKGS